MKPIAGDWLLVKGKSSQTASVRTVLLVLVAFGFGLASAWLWLNRSGKPEPKASVALSTPTQEILSRLGTPVELRFYCLLDSETPVLLRTYAQRTRELLGEYQKASAGKIVLLEQTNTDAETASGDGVRGFDFEKGQGSYLGLVISAAGNKIVLPQLSPAWEPALEADISRAIETLLPKANSKPTTTPAVAINASTLEELRQRIPNFDSISTEDALRISRGQAIEEFNAATTRMNQLVNEAQAAVAKAKREGSASDQESALKALQETQARQSEALKQIAAQAQERIEGIKKVKAGQPQAGRL